MYSWPPPKIQHVSASKTQMHRVCMLRLISVAELRTHDLPSFHKERLLHAHQIKKVLEHTYFYCHFPECIEVCSVHHRRRRPIGPAPLQP